jgi:RHS repeat-associated protein
MPNRTYSLSSSKYRFGFNGKEKDNEIYGEGNAIDFGARIIDTRIGRWLSVDPKSAKLPYLTPYNYVANNPIRFTDPDGQFLLDVHQRIAKNALSNFSIDFSRGSVQGKFSNGIWNNW